VFIDPVSVQLGATRCGQRGPLGPARLGYGRPCGPQHKGSPWLGADARRMRAWWRRADIGEGSAGLCALGVEAA